MNYYISHIVNNCDLLMERNPISAESGKLRTLYLAKSLESDVTIVSIGNPLSKGFFRKKKENIENNINIIYLSAFNFLGMKHLFFMISIANYTLKNIRKIDKVIIYNAMPHHTIPIVLLKFLLKYELILEIEELYKSYQYKGIKGKLVNISENIAIKYCDKYIITNPNMITSINTKKPFIVNRGYSTKAKETIISNYEKYKYNDEKPIILYSGRLDYEGGIEILLQSLYLISNECEVVITGKGPYEDKVKIYTNSNPKVRFRFLGFLKNEEYIKLLKSAKLCINPIRTELEFSKASFPSKILQYLEYGNMVISSNFQGIEEGNEINKYIIYYQDDNPLLLAKAIDIGIKMNVDKNSISREISNYLIDQEKKLFAFMNYTTNIRRD